MKMARSMPVDDKTSPGGASQLSLWLRRLPKVPFGVVLFQAHIVVRYLLVTIPGLVQSRWPP